MRDEPDQDRTQAKTEGETQEMSLKDLVDVDFRELAKKEMRKGINAEEHQETYKHFLEEYKYRILEYAVEDNMEGVRNMVKQYLRCMIELEDPEGKVSKIGRILEYQEDQEDNSSSQDGKKWYEGSYTQPSRGYSGVSRPEA